MISAKQKIYEAGNIFVIIFGAVALIATLNYAINLIIKGPLSSAVGLSRISGTDAKLLAHARVILSDAVLNQTDAGDVDGDGVIEPRPFDTSAGLGLTGGGAIPAILGLDDEDAWGSTIGYCVWDHGSADSGFADAGAGPPNRLQGHATDFTQIAIALVSPGDNRRFEAGCYAHDGAGDEGFVEVSGSDDVILALSYAEASETVGGTVSTIWQLSGGFDAAQSNIDIEVTSSNPGTDPRNVAVSGDGEFIALRIGDVFSNTASGAAIVVNDPMRMQVVSGASEPDNLPGDNAPLDISDNACVNGVAMTVKWDTATQIPDVACPPNFATLDPTIAAAGDDVTLSGGDLTASYARVGGGGGVPATASITSGKIYWEMTVNSTSGGTNEQFTIFTTNNSIDYDPATPAAGIRIETSVYSFDGNRVYTGDGSSGLTTITNLSPTTTSTDSGRVFGFALDLDDGELHIYRDGVVTNSGNPVLTGLSGTFTPVISCSCGSLNVTYNFGQNAWTHTPPSGHAGLTN